MPTIAEIARSLGFKAEGDVEIEILRPAHPSEATADALALAMDPKYLPLLNQGAARAAMIPEGADWRALGLEAAILTGRARFAMAGVTQMFAPVRDPAPGVHSSAIVSEDAVIGDGVEIGPLCVLETGVCIGDGCRILGQVTIGAGARIGPGALIHHGARICAGVEIGARAIIHPNACIGSDGFSFVTPEKGAVEAAKESGGATVVADAENTVWARIYSLGRVRIGDDVEIGAGATIDRGTVADTVIGSGSKLDNQVQVGHNVSIGENCILCGQVGVAGSAEIGDRVVLGGQSGVADHTKIGNDVLVMASSGASGNVKSGSIYGGTPALPRNELGKMLLAQRRLPRLVEDIEALKKRFSD